MRRIFLFALSLAGPGLRAVSGDALFLEKVQPVLVRDCQGCHGKLQALSGLDLSSRAGLLKGGARGPAVVPGNSAESLVLRAIEGTGAR